MGTVTIKSDKTDDLYFISEIAQRMGLNSEINIIDRRIGSGKKRTAQFKVTALSIAESIVKGLKEVEEIKAGKLKPLSLKDFD